MAFVVSVSRGHIMKKILLGVFVMDRLPSLGLFLHRVVFGGFMLVGHGWGKLMSFNDHAGGFPDPLGIGPHASMAGAVFCEVVCAALLVAGLLTRPAALGLVFTMAVAGFVVHGADPLFMGNGAAKEPALIYLAGYFLLLFTGPGRYSLDHLITRDRLRSDHAESRG